MRILLLLLVSSSALAQPIQEISSPANAGAAEPFLFAAKDSLLLSWLEAVPNSKDVALRFARYRNGKWSEPRTITKRSDLFVNWADFPSIGEDSHGVLYAHWLQKSGSSTYAYDVRIAVSKDDGLTWQPSFVLNRDGKQTEHGFASLVPMKSGVAVTWLDGRNMVPGKEEGEMTLRYATISASGAIANDVQLDDRTCECCATAMTMTTGGPLIAYRDRSKDEIRDISVTHKTAKGWSAPKPLHADGWKMAGCPVNGPQLDAIGNRVAAAWFTAANDRGRAYVAFSADGGATFSRPIHIDEGKPLGRLDVVMLDPETALVVWLEAPPSGAEIRARRVNRNGKPGPSVKVADSSTARAAGFPRAARVGRDVYFSWTEQNASSKRVHVARGRF